jgi:SAM-dependent methyltransferase
MSGDTAMMLQQVLKVLDKNGAADPAPAVQKAWRQGRRNWRDYYTSKAANEMLRPDTGDTSQSRLTDGMVFLRRVARAVRRRLFRPNWPPAVGRVKLGHLASTQPVSLDFGFDRGQPIDRYYIERFLADHASDVRGRVLEVGDASYSRQYGGSAVAHQDVLHIDPGQPEATIVGDLTDPNVLPNNTFDCIVLTQTLHLVFDLPAAVQRLHAALRPGGTLLLTAPGITPIERGRWGEIWYWSFTAIAIERLFAPVFGQGNCRVTTHGNVFAATAMLQGLAVREVPTSKLRETDTAFPVTVTLRARKAG